MEKRLERLRWRLHNSRDEPSSFDVLESPALAAQAQIAPRLAVDKENVRNANREMMVACDVASQAFAPPCIGPSGKQKSAMASYGGSLKRPARGGNGPRRVAFATVGRAHALESCACAYSYCQRSPKLVLCFSEPATRDPRVPRHIPSVSFRPGGFSDARGNSILLGRC